MTTHELIERLGTALEVAGVGLLVGGLLLAFARSLRSQSVRAQRVEAAAGPSTRSGRTESSPRYAQLRHDIGRAILLGLEVLVAADIVRSVALGPSMGELTVLAAIVAIRTFLSWSLALELDGRWPWQRPAPSPSPTGDTP